MMHWNYLVQLSNTQLFEGTYSGAFAMEVCFSCPKSECVSYLNRFSFSSYAITRLKQAPDDDLVLYLLQLVQALKYENFDDIEVSHHLTPES